MAIALVTDWSKLTKKDSDTSLTYGETLSENKFTGLSLDNSGAVMTTTIAATMPVNVALYANDEGVFAFASTDAIPTTKLTGWTLVGGGTATPVTDIGINSTVPMALGSIAITLASGSNKVMNFASNSVTNIGGSAGDDNVIISSALGNSFNLNFANGGTDKIYFVGSDDQKLQTLTASSGKTSLIASTGGSHDGAHVVLGGDLGATTIKGSAAGDALTFTTAADATVNLTQSSGNIVFNGVSGTSISSLSLTEHVKGKFTASSASIVALTAGTLAGGEASFRMQEDGLAKIGLISGAKVTVSGTTLTLAADSITAGSLTAKKDANQKTVSAVITEKGTFAYDGLTLAAGTTLKEAKFSGTSIEGAAQTIAGASITAGSGFAFAGTGADVISIDNIGANSKVTLVNTTGADTLSVGTIAAGGYLKLQDDVAGMNSIQLGSGSTFENVVVSSGTTGAEVFKANDKAVNLNIESIGAASITGSDLADTFDFKAVDTGKTVTIAGGSGNDVYNFATGLAGTVSITDFGWSNSAESAADTSKGEDILLVSNLDPTTMATVKLLGDGTVELGSSKIVANAGSGIEAAYVKIGTSVGNAKTYKVTSGGAKQVGSDGPNKVDPDTTSGGKVYDASSAEHAYIDAGSGESTVKNFTTYTGTNERTASILNPEPMTLDNVKSSTDANGNVTLTDGTNTVLMEGLGSNKMIKMGDTVSSAAVVLVGTGTDTVTEAVENAASRYIGDTLGTSMLDFTNTDKKVIDLSGKNSDDTVTYQNIAKVTGSDDGKSLLVSGSTGVSLQSAGAGDTLSGAGKGNDMLISNSKEATTFLLQSGGGSDSISGFLSGKDTLAIDTSMAYDGSLFKASSGAVVVGDSGSSYSIASTSSSGAVVNYVYGEGEDAPYGKALVDVSASGGNIAYADGVNLVFGQGAKSTLSVASGDTVSPDKGREAEPSGIGWNSMILTTDVGTIDGTDSKMTAFNGQGGYSQTVKASTVVDADTPVWLCGGLQAGYADAGNDTLVASGNGNNVVWVGAKMGNDVIQGLTSGDTVGFLATKIGDYASAADAISDIVKVTENGFTATFSGGNTITGAFASTSDKITNLVFHFDQTEEGVANDYRWDGKGLVAITSTATA